MLPIKTNINLFCCFALSWIYFIIILCSWKIMRTLKEGAVLIFFHQSWTGHSLALMAQPKSVLQAILDIKSRNRDACLKGFEVNLSSFKSIIGFKDSLQQWLWDSNMHPSVQLLINNAGILATSCRSTSQGYDELLSLRSSFISDWYDSFFSNSVLECKRKKWS